MIQHIRPLSVALPYNPYLDEVEDPISLEDELLEAEAFEAEFDESLDHLLKHAFKTTSQAKERDTGHVWQQLSRRVQGPFGYAALEAPALDSLEAELLSSGGRVQQAPFVLNDKVTERAKRPTMERASAVDGLWDMLRFGAPGRALGGSAGVPV